jgi:hypothetical protein
LPTEDEISGATPGHRPPKPSPTSIGNHKLKPQSLMLGYGFDPELNWNGSSNFSTAEFLTQPPVRYFTARVSLNW